MGAVHLRGAAQAIAEIEARLGGAGNGSRSASSRSD